MANGTTGDDDTEQRVHTPRGTPCEVTHAAREDAVASDRLFPASGPSG